ncbi:MAG: hypothetical protein KDB37_07625 [Ilumatobacter sp.]|nr:hypothetical protein [Ilumatobacter sp.]
MAPGLEGGNRSGRGPLPRTREHRRQRRALVGLVLVAGLALTACGDEEEPQVVAPGLLQSLPTGDYEAATTLTELAERSDRVTMGTVVDVEEGFRFGDAADDPGASRFIELIVESGELDGPIHVVWPYEYGYDIDVIRESMPIGAPIVLYLTDFRTIAAEKGWYHLGPDDGHTHWIPTTPQGVILADSEAGVARLGDPSAPLTDAPPVDGDFEAWLVGGTPTE